MASHTLIALCPLAILLRIFGAMVPTYEAGTIMKSQVGKRSIRQRATRQA